MTERADLSPGSSPQLVREPFVIHLDETMLIDLLERIAKTRWPDQIPAIGWAQGTNLDYLEEMLGYWAASSIGEHRSAGSTVSISSAQGSMPSVCTSCTNAHVMEPGSPLILTHGWPSRFADYLPLVPLLTDPKAHGIDGPALDVVIPSLPGYGFSERPSHTGVNALNDSPAGLAAWMLEKWRSWGDTDGDLDSRFSRDFLLTTVMLYWATQTITSSMRDDFDNRMFGVGPDDYVTVPTAVAMFTHSFEHEGDPPREWAERLYNVRQWTSMPAGGHFAPVEEPSSLARDIAGFFAAI